MPFHSLKQPMLLNAFLACGVRHLTLVNPAAFPEEKAIYYYDKASKYLLRALQNPNRNSVICATTAVILNVYEIMTEKALPRMNHIAGARALIKECCWDARSTGIGSACFWLNVGLETLSNLHFNWQSSWKPDDWGLELDLSQETMAGREESWTLRMLFIIAKISDFRATIPFKSDASPRTEQMRRQERYEEWTHLKDMTDTWNNSIPRTMHPIAYLYPSQTSSLSVFPEIWLCKRTTVIARLFYHTALVLLAQINPARANILSEMEDLEDHHAHQICGIVAHVKDRGVASVALRCLAHAAECLTDHAEQDEVLRTFSRIHRETGWRIGFIPHDLRQKWGWGPPETSASSSTVAPNSAAVSPRATNGSIHLTPYAGVGGVAGAATSPNTTARQPPVNGTPAGLGGTTMSTPLSPHSPQYQFDQYAEVQNLRKQQRAAQAAAALASQAQAAQQAAQHLSPHNAPQFPNQQSAHHQQQQNQTSPPAERRVPPQGIVNPMFAIADFTNPKHPYQEHYVAPSWSHRQAALISGDGADGSGHGLGLGIQGMYAGGGMGGISAGNIGEGAGHHGYQNENGGGPGGEQGWGQG